MAEFIGDVFRIKLLSDIVHFSVYQNVELYPIIGMDKLADEEEYKDLESLSLLSYLDIHISQLQCFRQNRYSVLVNLSSFKISSSDI